MGGFPKNQNFHFVIFERFLTLLHFDFEVETRTREGCCSVDIKTEKKVENRKTTLGVQINVLGGRTVRNNKHTGPNKDAGWKF